MCPSGRTPATAVTATPTQASCFRSAFEVIDADRDGKISGDDLRSFYTDLEADADETAIKSMIMAVDSNKDGFVEYEEFERAILPGKSSIMEEVFKIMDKDGDGKLSHGDLKSYMSLAGFSLTDDDITAMIALANSDHHHHHHHDGVSFQGLLKILAVDHHY